MLGFRMAGRMDGARVPVPVDGRNLPRASANPAETPAARTAVRFGERSPAALARAAPLR